MPPRRGGSSALVTPVKLSSLCTATLASILELTRAHQAELTAAPSLVASIRANLGSIRTGLDALQGAAQSDGDREMLEGLQRQHRRLVDLVQGLGYQVETPAASPAVPEDVMYDNALLCASESAASMSARVGTCR